MSDKEKTCSPYKALIRKNRDYCAFARMPDLTPNKAYMMYDIKHTIHKEFGDGELAFLQDNKQAKIKVQLPNKYLNSLTPEMVKGLYDDVANEKYPYLVYRKRLVGGSFMMDVFPHIEPLIGLHLSWDDVPPSDELALNLDSSTESVPQSVVDNENDKEQTEGNKEQGNSNGPGKRDGSNTDTNASKRRKTE